jgi:hypothetical protein
LGGADGAGTVFEIAKTGGSYASAPTTLVNFNDANGGYPYAGLIADAAGDLFGTTTGVPPATGSQVSNGTAFELTGTGFQVAAPAPVLSGGGNTVNYTPGGAAVAIDGGLGVSDAKSTTLASATGAASY